MRFFNTFIRVMLPKEIARKSQVLSLLYVLSFSALMISTLYTNSIPQAVLALLGTIYMTSYYTKKLTSLTVSYRYVVKRVCWCMILQMYGIR